MESMTAPPSQQYYSQFENQELTIIKQRNSSFQEGIPSGDMTQFPPVSGPNVRQPINPNSPMASRSSSITNITSASLANLAKGVEQNINQMQQTMMEGGPFRDLQQQQQQPGAQPLPGPNAPHMGMPQGGPNSVPSSSGAPSSQPSVNNTFVNAHMSIAQVNIQNVNASQQHAGYDSHGQPTQMQQNVDVTMNTGNMSANSQRFNDEPNFNPQNRASNSVKVQPKGASTLQYVPMSQPALPSGNESILPPKQSYDFMNERFPSPLTNLENKTPTSKISYYPDNSRLPPPPPQRLPMSVSGSIPMSSQGQWARYWYYQ